MKGLAAERTRDGFGARPVLLVALLLASLIGAGCGSRPAPAPVDPAIEVPTAAPLDSDAAASPVVATADLNSVNLDEGAAPAPGIDDAGPAQGVTQLSRLTEPGCCVQPWWSADSRAVQFIDRPSADAPAGIWSVAVDAPGSPPRRVADEVANYTSDLAYRVDVGPETTTIERRSDGERWTVPAAGRPISFSPDRSRIAWQESTGNNQNNARPARVWVAAVDGTGAREVATVPRGALSGWLGNDRLLVRGRDSQDADEEVLWALDLADGNRRELARAERLRGELPAPGGDWVAYYVAQSSVPDANGVWLVSTTGGAPERLDASLFGAYRWRDGQRLLVVPLRADAAVHELVEVDPATLELRHLTDPATTPFKIANGDWAVAPDGRRVAFVESKDRAIWVLTLPEGATGQSSSP
jgi:hypothetical protein